MTIIIEDEHLGGYVKGGDSESYAPRLWDALIADYHIKSVIDVGCGEGHASKYFADKGAAVLAIDGSEKVLSTAVYKPIIIHDYHKGAYIPNRVYDLGWCCEFLEHIDEEYLPNFMATFKKAKIAAITHALPGQTGHHHVNEKNKAYWIEQFKKYGFRYKEKASMKYRSLNEPTYFSISGMIFINKALPAPKIKSYKKKAYADYHPKMNTLTNAQKMMMVVARYNENLDWLKKVPWNYVVYNKGGDLPKWVKNEIKLKDNVGREAYAYLTYITDNYDTLPDYLVFVPGNPFDHSPELIKKINDFDGQDDFFPLSSIFIDKYENREMGPELAESLRRLFIDEIKSFKYFEYPEGSVFMVSKKAILFHKKIAYQKIIASMREAELVDDEAIGYRVFSAKFPQGRKRLFHKKTADQEIINSMTNEKTTIEGIFSAWVMEILWKTLFDKKHKTVYD